MNYMTLKYFLHLFEIILNCLFEKYENIIDIIKKD